MPAGLQPVTMEEGGLTVVYKDVTPLPLDDKCLHGTLSNGLTYYIQNNKKPEARAELRLVVKIGSVYEEDDEQGLAHVVEHLAFRGTKLYDTFEVVKYLESVGAKFGACQNACTKTNSSHVPIMLLAPCLPRCASVGAPGPSRFRCFSFLLR